MRLRAIGVEKPPGWLSDVLCRAVTGDALVRRRLYTDSEVAVVSFRRFLAIASLATVVTESRV